MCLIWLAWLGTVRHDVALARCQSWMKPTLCQNAWDRTDTTNHRQSSFSQLHIYVLWQVFWALMVFTRKLHKNLSCHTLARIRRIEPKLGNNELLSSVTMIVLWVPPQRKDYVIARMCSNKSCLVHPNVSSAVIAGKKEKLANMFRAILNPLSFCTVVLCGAGRAGKSLAGQMLLHGIARVHYWFFGRSPYWGGSPLHVSTTM